MLSRRETFREERGRLSGGALYCAKSQIVLIQRWQRQDRTGHIPCTYKTAKQSSHGRLTLRVTLTRDSLVWGENLAITCQAARAAVWLSATHGGHGVRRSLFTCSSMNVFNLYISNHPPTPTPTHFLLLALSSFNHVKKTHWSLFAFIHLSHLDQKERGMRFRRIGPEINGSINPVMLITLLHYHLLTDFCDELILLT